MDIITGKNRLNRNIGDGIGNSALKLTRRQFLAFATALAASGYRLSNSSEAIDVVVIEGLGRSGNSPLASRMKSSLDLALSRLTDQKQDDSAWSSLSSPGGEMISIKVDVRSPLACTNPDLTVTVLEHLFDLGIQPWDVTIWDKRISDVNAMANVITTRRGIQKIVSSEAANQNDLDARGYREEGSYQPVWLEETQSPLPSLFSVHLPDSGAKIINLPTAKQHPVAGIDGALTSLAIGAVNNVNRFWSSPQYLAQAVADIWKMKALSGHVLTIMDATRVLFHGGPVGLPSWVSNTDALILGFDPVAVDSVALGMIEARRKAAQFPPLGEEGNLLLKEAERAGVGKAEPIVVHLNAAL